MLRTLGANRRQILASSSLEAFADRARRVDPRGRAGIGFAPVIGGAVRGARHRPAEHRDRDRATDRDRRPRCSAPGSPCSRRCCRRCARPGSPPVTGLREGAVPADPERAPQAHRRRGRARRRSALAADGARALRRARPGARPGSASGAAARLPRRRPAQPAAGHADRLGRRGAARAPCAAIPGRLARENAIRNPAAPPSTAAALMIGLALVSFVAVFAAGLRGSIDDAIDKTIAGDLIVSNDDGFSDIPVRHRRRRSRGSTGSRSPRRCATPRTRSRGTGRAS